MSDLEKTLLPQTATPLAKALDILEDRLFALPVGMITKDPFEVDAALLDHLAWEHSVDVWDVDWPEITKRNVIAASAEVHRFKGTPHAIRAALGAFGVDADILEWWQPGGIAAGFEAGSFRVTAFVMTPLYGENENILNTRMLDAMTAVVHRAAPVSRKLLLRLGERFRTDAFMRTAAAITTVHREEIDPGPRPAMSDVAAHARSGVRLSQATSGTLDPAPRPVPGASVTALRTRADATAVSVEFHDVQRRASA